jgi:hypothetical protein
MDFSVEPDVFARFPGLRLAVVVARDVDNGGAGSSFDLEITRFGAEGWRATFSPAGRAHSVAARSAWEATPWRAIQRAAREVLG